MEEEGEEREAPQTLHLLLEGERGEGGYLSLSGG